MDNWWEIGVPDPDAPALVRAVAYYRHSAQDRQENSIPIQQDRVRAWALEHGVEIIREFCDAGKSGLNSEGRPAFTEMMEEWISKRDDFEYVLCLDVSRWGRFQDIDLSAQFSAICKKHKKQVIYTTIGKPKENDPLYPVYVQFERFRAAQYSRELSDKVWRGCVKIAEQGYLAGGPPPYGLSRLLLEAAQECPVPFARNSPFGCFAQKVVLKTPANKRAKANGNKTPWTQADEKKSQLLKKLQEAEQQQDFYTGLYRQYTTNLLKLVIYVRSLLNNADVRTYLQTMIHWLRNRRATGESLVYSEVCLEYRDKALAIRRTFGSWAAALEIANQVD